MRFEHRYLCGWSFVFLNFVIYSYLYCFRNVRCCFSDLLRDFFGISSGFGRPYSPEQIPNKSRRTPAKELDIRYLS